MFLILKMFRANIVKFIIALYSSNNYDQCPGCPAFLKYNNNPAGIHQTLHVSAVQIKSGIGSCFVVYPSLCAIHNTRGIFSILFV